MAVRRKMRNIFSKVENKTFKYSLETMESRSNEIKFSLCSKKITNLN